jgi:hypothetical protein
VTALSYRQQLFPVQVEDVRRLLRGNGYTSDYQKARDHCWTQSHCVFDPIAISRADENLEAHT